jgi:hypothetical protein
MIDFELACSLRHGRNEQFPQLLNRGVFWEQFSISPQKIPENLGGERKNFIFLSPPRRS